LKTGAGGEKLAFRVFVSRLNTGRRIMTDTVELAVRLARTDDAAGIASIFVDSWRETYAGILPTRALSTMSKEQQQRYWAGTVQHANLRNPVFVAADAAGQLFGFCSAGPNRDRVLPHEAEIYTLYVAPGHTSQGIGTALMQTTFQFLSRAQCRSMLIWALAENPSRFFYEAMGGQRVAERMHPLWGGTYAEVAYGWDTLDLSSRVNTSASARQ
jgi:GNAT superfamily N-acetyltransferase